MARGAVLIGCGFMPSQEDVRTAVSQGYVENAENLTTYSGDEAMTQEQATMRYVAAQVSKGWDIPMGGLTANKVTFASGRNMWVVCPA